jgi:hypothetical protein
MSDNAISVIVIVIARTQRRGLTPSLFLVMVCDWTFGPGVNIAMIWAVTSTIIRSRGDQAGLNLGRASLLVTTSPR